MINLLGTGLNLVKSIWQKHHARVEDEGSLRSKILSTNNIGIYVFVFFLWPIAVAWWTLWFPEFMAHLSTKKQSMHVLSIIEVIGFGNFFYIVTFFITASTSVNIFKQVNMTKRYKKFLKGDQDDGITDDNTSSNDCKSIRRKVLSRRRK